MPFITLLFAIDLILTGIVGYQVTGAQSPTALIPAAIGLLLFVCGVISFKANLRKHAMHGAAVIGLLGIVGTASVFSDLGVILEGKIDTLARPAASVSRLITAMICIHFVLICMWSFIEARMARTAKPAA
jgi:hypothetical protein